MGKRQLTAEQWRVISYLYHPDQLSRRTSPSLAVIINKQAVDRDDVVEVVERGLVQARVGGEECTRGPLKRLPEKAIRLRLTKAGIYHAHTDPQHLVMCALRTTGQFTLWNLMYRFNVQLQPGAKPLAPTIGFGELCEMADRLLFTTLLLDGDIPVDIREVEKIPGLAYARQTKKGASYAAYL